ncbi:hypothetical protein RHS01_03388 [Rhizoctonia solani]|uniref:Uncharacterized protein n=1 Tax=Rhizoctonia solani TaxID=456999 RepID=A0A8H7M6V2_9AGAM|nr:hypothetical protein RHS01_03388 [Rhizoctonia solani]
MGRLHFSSAPKYQKAAEPVCEVQTFPTWPPEAYCPSDQSFDPEAEVLSGHMMVYEAFLDRDGRPPHPDDADVISELSESSSSAATDDEEYPTLRRMPRLNLAPPSAPDVVLPPSTGSSSNDFEDFVRIEVPTLISQRALTERPPAEVSEASQQRDDEEHLFNYYQNYSGGPRERERTHYPTRVLPPIETRGSPARRLPGHARFLPRADGHRAPLASSRLQWTIFTNILALALRRFPTSWRRALVFRRDGSRLSTELSFRAEF